MSSSINGTHSFKSINQITTIHDRSCPPFPDCNFNGADQERSVLTKVKAAYSVQCVIKLSSNVNAAISYRGDSWLREKLERRKNHKEKPSSRDHLDKACSIRRSQKSKCVLNTVCLFYNNFLQMGRLS